MGCRCARRERAPLPRRVMRRLRSYRPRSMRAGDCPNFRGHRREALVRRKWDRPPAAAACDAHLLEMHIHLTTLAEGVGRFKGSFCATSRLLLTCGEIGKAGPRRQAHFCRLSGGGMAWFAAASERRRVRPPRALALRRARISLSLWQGRAGRRNSLICVPFSRSSRDLD